jgi:mono/diheme cytochrome c family protein
VRNRFAISAVLVMLALLPALSAGAKPEDKSKDSPAPAATVAHATQAESAMRLEGEKRFRANCARCHAAPPTFPPRMMATIVRHMRVRANITDQDRRLILRYMTQ